MPKAVPGENAHPYFGPAYGNYLQDANEDIRRMNRLRRLYEAEEKARKDGLSLRQFAGEGADNREMWEYGYKGSPLPAWRIPFTDDWFDSHGGGPSDPYNKNSDSDSTGEDAGRWDGGATHLEPWDWRALGLDPDDYPGHVWDERYGRGQGNAPQPNSNGDNVPDQGAQMPPGWRPAAHRQPLGPDVQRVLDAVWTKFYPPQQESRRFGIVNGGGGSSRATDMTVDQQRGVSVNNSAAQNLEHMRRTEQNNAQARQYSVEGQVSEADRIASSNRQRATREKASEAARQNNRSGI